MERQLSVGALLITLIAAIFAVVAADYGILDKNVSAVIATILAFLHVNPTILATIITIPATIALIRILPLHIRCAIVGRRLGDVQVFTNRDDLSYQKAFDKEVTKCATIDVIGIGNSQITEKELGKLLTYAIGTRRVSLRVLFLDPEGVHIKVREKEEGFDQGWLAGQVHQHSRYLLELRKQIEKKYPHSEGLIRYAYYDKYPSTNAVFFDSRTMFKQVYFYSLRGRANPIFFLQKQHSEIVASLAAEFEALWKSARLPERL